MAFEPCKKKSQGGQSRDKAEIILCLELTLFLDTTLPACSIDYLVTYPTSFSSTTESLSHTLLVNFRMHVAFFHLKAAAACKIPQTNVNTHQKTQAVTFSQAETVEKALKNL